jgi:hypothetical protein
MGGGMAVEVAKKDAGGWSGGVELSVEMIDRLNAVSAYLCIYPVPSMGVTKFMQKLVPDAKWHSRSDYSTNYGRWKSKRGTRILIDHIDQVEHYIRSNTVADRIAEISREIEAAKKKKAIEKAKSAEVKLEKQNSANKCIKNLLAASAAASAEAAWDARRAGRAAPEDNIVQKVKEFKRLRVSGVSTADLQVHREIATFNLRPHQVQKLLNERDRLLALQIADKARQSSKGPAEKADDAKADRTVRYHLWRETAIASESGNAVIMARFLKQKADRDLCIEIAKLSKYELRDSLRRERLRLAELHRIRSQFLNAQGSTLVLEQRTLSFEQCLHGKTLLCSWIATLSREVSTIQQVGLAQLQFDAVLLTVWANQGWLNTRPCSVSHSELVLHDIFCMGTHGAEMVCGVGRYACRQGGTCVGRMAITTCVPSRTWSSWTSRPSRLVVFERWRSRPST